MNTRFGGIVVVVLTTPVAVGMWAQAQQTPVPLSPAPRLAIGTDAQGRPLPFGVPPYYSHDTPLGSGPYKAIMATDPSLPEHVLYHPQDLRAGGRWPIVVWGNGGCLHAGNRYRGFLTEIASHGILVISAGRMGHQALEVAPQENPYVARPGGPPRPEPAPPIENDPTAPWRDMDSTVDHMRDAMDWAIAENGRQGSAFYGKLDVKAIGAGGSSCGGGLTTRLASDPRLTTIAILNSGSRLQSRFGREVTDEQAAQRREALDAIHTPTLIMTGDEYLDSAYWGGRDTFEYLSKVPVFYAWQEGLSHISTYGQDNGGQTGRIVSDWYTWQLRADQEAGRMFSGEGCILCREPGWHVQKKNMN